MRFESMGKSQSADEYLRIFDKLFFDLLSGFSLQRFITVGLLRYMRVSKLI